MNRSETIRQRGDCDLGNKSPDTLGISVLLIVVIGGLAGITGIVAALIGARHLRITQALRDAHRVRSGVILRERSDTGVIEVPFTAEVIAIARIELLCSSCHATGTLQAGHLHSEGEIWGACDRLHGLIGWCVLQRSQRSLWLRRAAGTAAVRLSSAPLPR